MTRYSKPFTPKRPPSPFSNFLALTVTDVTAATTVL